MKLRITREFTRKATGLDFDENFAEYEQYLMTKRLLEENKSYCNNADLFFHVDLPRPRRLSHEEYQRQAEYLKKLKRKK